MSKKFINRLRITRFYPEIKDIMKDDKAFYPEFEKKILQSIDFFYEYKFLVNKEDQLSDAARNLLMETLTENAHKKGEVNFKGQTIEERFKIVAEECSVHA